MDAVALPDGRKTSRLGFGCALLVDRYERRQSVRLVHAALDAGITHFDTAPVYGMGTADDALRHALAGRRGDVTITTKVGIARPKAQGLIGLARRIAKPMLASLPGLRARLAKSVQGQASARGQFSPSQARAALAESLERLGTDHVDLLLLHQVDPGAVSDELLRFLEERKAAGAIGAYGIGTTRQDGEAIARAWPQLVDVVQTGFSVPDPPPLRGTALTITHGALRGSGELRKSLQADSARRRQFEDATGLDLTADLTAALLCGAYTAHDGIVLVATRNPDHLAANVAAVSDARLREAGRKLAGLLPVGPPPA
ncbi:MAG TPA: aldo/keto reductase [Rhizomicrobium sp.]